MELSEDHIALLQALEELQGADPDRHPSTRAVGEELLKKYKQRGEPYSWHSSEPWHGTAPMARELEAAGLIECGSGMAQFSAPGTPAPTVNAYYLGLTDDGEAALRKHREEVV